MVLYFSGTGNSKFVASALADRLGDDLVGLNEYIKQEKQGIFHSEKAWVVVFPIYCSTIPNILVKFLQKSELTGSKEMYFIGTCAGAVGASTYITQQLCQKKGMTYKGVAKVIMPQNYIALFKMTEPDEKKRRVDNAYAVTESFAKIILEHGMFQEKMVSKIEFVATRAIEELYDRHFTKTKKFFATEKCIGCGACERLCPINNIKLVEGKPHWNGKCLHCMACINRCPKEAIEYGKNTQGKERHYCKEYVSYKKG